MVSRPNEYIRPAHTARVLVAVVSIFCNCTAISEVQREQASLGLQSHASATQVRDLRATQAIEEVMKPVTLSILNSLAAPSEDPERLPRLVDTLLSYLGADTWDYSFRNRIRLVLTVSESDPNASISSRAFLSQLNDFLDTHQMRSVYTLSDSGLFQTRTALSRTMPNIFTNPSENPVLRPIERLYILHLLWENGTLEKEKQPLKPRGITTTVIFSNGRRSRYMGIRNQHLQQMSQPDLQNAFNQLCILLGSSVSAH